jgi:hypothetical protein
MRLSEIKSSPVINEGGNMFDNSGVIHRSEIEPTLKYLQKITGIKDLDNRVLGSVGKKEYSGDIDVVVDPLQPEALEAFHNKLQSVFGSDSVRRQGQLLSINAPIQNYNPDNDQRHPRTGYVQVDFMFGEKDWLKVYRHSPGEGESKLKGAHRNVALCAVAAHLDRDATSELDDFGRPQEVIRWKWSPKDGLVKVHRKSRINSRTGQTIKKQEEVVLTEPLRDADKIAKTLFKGQAGKESLNSVESIVAAVKKSFGEKEQEAIFKEMAKNFQETKVKGGNFEYPSEIAKYMQDES